MDTFRPQGAIQSVTASTAAPTSVQAKSNSNVNAQFYMLTNTSSTVDAVIGWGQSDIEAKINAANPANGQNCFYLPFLKQAIIAGPRDGYFSGITETASAVVKIQPGIIEV